ncbi:MAG: zinc ribbon domain-containing protein [Ktedonobacteraceae bacterium]
MAQAFPPSCPHCGTPATPGQRFCSNCGGTLDAGFGVPTAAASSGEHYPQVPDLSTQLSTPPPPPTSSYSQPAQQSPNTYYPPQAPQNSPTAQQSYQPLPAYTQPQKDASRSVLSQIGCGVGLIILAVLAVCGGTGYLGYRWLVSTADSVHTTTSSNTGTGNNTGSKGTATVPLTTKNINAALTYASVDITILNAQEASSFSDDSSPSSPVLLRVNMKQHNPTASTIFLSYGENFHLILPDGTSVTPASEHDIGAVDQAVTKTSWVDFPLSSSMDISKLTLRLGGANQVQEDVPLTGNADLSKYQAKTISPNTAFQYAGVKWTLTTVTSSFSANGKQADSSMRYIVITLKLDNPTSSVFFPGMSTYTRLKSGEIINSPKSDTFPIDVAAGTTGTTGTVTFLMPQNNSSFTLTMLARTDTTPPAPQVTRDFQI